MATKRKSWSESAPPRRDDWAVTEEIELTDGRKAVRWQNLITGETASLLPGVHPMDNANAIVPAPEGSTDGVSYDDENIEETAVDRLATMMRAVSGEDRAFVRIARVKQDGTRAYCEQATPEQFEANGIDYIRNKWGPGKFEVVLFAPNPRNGGRFSRFGAQHLEIEPAANSETSQLTGLLSNISERLHRIETAPPPPAPHPADEMSRMLAIMKTMREALGISNAPPPPPPSPAETLKEMMLFFDMAKKVRNEIEPTPEPSDPLAANLPRVLDLIGGAMQHQRASVEPQYQQPQPSMPTIAIPPSMQPPSIPVASNDPQQIEQVQQSEEMMQLQFAIAMLNARAARDAEIEDSAAQVYEFAPDELLDLLESEQWFEHLQSLAPSIAKYRDWYTRVRGRVLQMINEDAENESESTAVPAPAAAPLTKTG